MLDVRSASRRRLASAVLLCVPLAACTIDDEGAQAKPISTTTAESLYPVPTPRYSSRQETYVRFELGREGSPKLTAPDDAVKCDVNPNSGTRTYRAATSDFMQFDKGSERPGQDFSIELYVAGNEAPAVDSNRTESDSPPFALFLEYVTEDGSHRSFQAQDGVDVYSSDADGFRSVGFSTQDTAGDIALTGVITCATVEQVP